MAARSWLANLFATLRLMVVPLGQHIPYQGYIEKLRRSTVDGWSCRPAFAGRRGPGLEEAQSLGLLRDLWFLVGILPTVTVWKNADGMADRYVFIASFGLILAAIALLSAGSAHLPINRFRTRARKARHGAGGGVPCLLRRRHLAARPGLARD